MTHVPNTTTKSAAASRSHRDTYSTSPNKSTGKPFIARRRSKLEQSNGLIQKFESEEDDAAIARFIPLRKLESDLSTSSLSVSVSSLGSASPLPQQQPETPLPPEPEKEGEREPEMTAAAAMDLPEDIWELVFRRLGDDRLMDPLSLVCRRFLYITNSLRSNLTISDRTIGGGRGFGCLLPLFRRFPNIQRISITNFHGDLSLLIREISLSDLQLSALDLTGQRQWFPRPAMVDLGGRMGVHLKTLVLARFLLLENDDVLAIAASFPNLEELDISNPQQELHHTCPLRQMVTDDAIAFLSSSLRNLRLIRLSGNHFLSDDALISLALNCPLLAEIVVHDCSFMRGSGVAFALRHCRNLASISVNKVSPLTLGRERDLFFHATALRRLCLSRMAVPDGLLGSIAEAGLPLVEFSLSECSGLSIPCLAAALRACSRSLRLLVLFGLGLLSDERMIALLPYLGTLNSIDLSCCFELSNITFFSIVENCPCIEKIEMRNTNLGRGVLLVDLCANRGIRTLNLAENTYLDDDTIQHIGKVCPQLQSLDVSHCWEVTGEGMGMIGELCQEITDLSMKGCNKIKNLGTGFGFRRLETLQASGSGLEDEVLLSIALRCGMLLRLDLRGCSGVTEKGVKEVVREGKRLQQLYMDAHNVDIHVLSFIVFSRPLLRKIVWQSGSLPVKMQDLFLRHGCMVSASI